MELGIIGLGRMGGNIAQRLLRAGHSVVAYDHDAHATQGLADKGAAAAEDTADLVRRLEAPRAVWVMLPAGAVTEAAIEQLATLLSPGDVIIDGGNTFYKDDVRRAAVLREHGITYLDVGTSGGVWGLDRGYCMMIGGEKETVERLDPIFAALAPGVGTIPRTPGREEKANSAEQGYLYCGPAGSGHFVKMVHNGIEYGLMQAYAEGFDLMRSKGSAETPENQRLTLDLADIAELWRRGSVVSSWLLDLTAISLTEDSELHAFSGRVDDSGEGRWTVEAAVEQSIPAHVLTAALFARFRSRTGNTFGEKMLSAMRKQFGGHLESVRPTEKAVDVNDPGVVPTGPHVVAPATASKAAAGE